MHRPSPRPPVPHSLAARRGQALVEFGIIAFVFTLLIAGILTFGLLLHGANVIQQAADVGAMEFSRLPLPPLAEFPELGGPERTSTDPFAEEARPGHPNVFNNTEFREQIFDESFLVIRDSSLPPQQSFADYMTNNAPLINRLLLPVYITETVPLDGPPEVVYRYPGAIVRNTSSPEPDAYSVLIPISTGADSFEWRAVVEEIRDSSGAGPLSLDSSVTAVNPGMVALRINYPFQSGAMLQYRYELDGQSASLNEVIGADGVTAFPVEADDELISMPPVPAPYALVVPSNYVQSPGNDLVKNTTHSGEYGLGRSYAFLGAIRPYRKVLSAQGIYRREVFAP